MYLCNIYFIIFTPIIINIYTITDILQVFYMLSIFKFPFFYALS